MSDNAKKLYEWIREPDWAETFSVQDMADWIDRRPIVFAKQLADASDHAPCTREPVTVTDGALKDAATEYLSHRGENPYRVLRGGSQLWETHVAAMKAAFDVVNRLHAPPVRSAAIAAEPVAWPWGGKVEKAITVEGDLIGVSVILMVPPQDFDKLPAPYKKSAEHVYATPTTSPNSVVADYATTETNRLPRNELDLIRGTSPEIPDNSPEPAVHHINGPFASPAQPLSQELQDTGKLANASPEPVAVMDRDMIAAIIEPEAMAEYEAEFAKKPGGPTYTMMANYPQVKAARDKADAILAAISRPAHGGWETDALKALKPFADAARGLTSTIGPDGIDDGVTVECQLHGRHEREFTLSSADFSFAAAVVARNDRGSPANG